MQLIAQRRIISEIALAAFLFGIALPALAVTRQAIDPASFATICRVDTGADAGVPALSGSAQTKLKSAHCLMCLGTASLPSAPGVASLFLSIVPELILPVDRCLRGRRCCDSTAVESARSAAGLTFTAVSL